MINHHAFEKRTRIREKLVVHLHFIVAFFFATWVFNGQTRLKRLVGIVTRTLVIDVKTVSFDFHKNEMNGSDERLGIFCHTALGWKNTIRFKRGDESLRVYAIARGLRTLIQYFQHNNILAVATCWWVHDKCRVINASSKLLCRYVGPEYGRHAAIKCWMTTTVWLSLLGHILWRFTWCTCTQAQ